MELAFKIVVVLMLTGLSFALVEMHQAHKAVVEKHEAITDRIANFVEQRLEHVELPARKGKR